MSWIVSAVGVVVVVAVLRDVFHTLFHPAGEGSLSRQLMRVAWRAVGRARGRGREALFLAGPVGFLAVLAAWTTLLIVGFGLVYWPHLDTAFVVAPGLSQEGNDGFLDAVYFSATALATLGYGDLAATSAAWRLLATAQGLVGLGLLTAAVSWLISLYAALQRRRALAGTVFAIADGDDPTTQALEALAARVASVRTDLMQHGALYYFHSRDVTLELAAALPALGALADAEREGARTLRAATDALVCAVAEDFLQLDEPSPEAAVRAWLADHRVGDVADDLARRVSARHRARRCHAASVS